VRERTEVTVSRISRDTLRASLTSTLDSTRRT
jgi:hypothetical protein